ncbi:DUF5067 domain-containing protein [[Clostridium] innocuum]|nr:DUF5067 domain-containing protein [[Clostridium] innocuum]
MIKQVGMIGVSILCLFGCSTNDKQKTEEKEVIETKDIENGKFSLDIKDMFLARDKYGKDLLVVNAKIRNKSDITLDYMEVYGGNYLDDRYEPEFSAIDETNNFK